MYDRLIRQTGPMLKNTSQKTTNIFIAQTGQRQFSLGPVLKVKITPPMFGFATKTLEH